MSLNDLGAVPASSTIYLFWTSHDGATGANEAASNLAVGDILIYKNGSVTQRSATNGFTLLDTDGLDFDGLTGVNGVSIDLSDNTDAGFYAVGSWYTVILGPITIDTQTVYLNLASFRIVAAEAITGKPKVDVDGWLGTAAATPTTNGVPEVDVTHWLGTAAATPTVAGVPEVDVTHWLGTAAATPTVAGVPEVDLTHVAGSTTSVSTLASSVATLLADIGGVATAAADGDPTNTDLLFAYIKQLINILIGSAGIVTWPASAAPANAVSMAEALRYLYDQVGVAGAGLTAADDAVIAAIPSAATIADAVWDEDATAHQTGGTFGQAIGDPGADTNTIFKAVVTDATGATVGVDGAAILADTDEIQQELADGGRTDLLIDAIKAKTDQLTFTVANQVDANALTLDEDEILDDSLADSVPADGSLPTVRQSLYMIWQFLSERSVSGTTLTVKKADGSTSLMTFTLDDATSPTAISRAT